MEECICVALDMNFCKISIKLMTFKIHYSNFELSKLNNNYKYNNNEPRN